MVPSKIKASQVLGHASAIPASLFLTRHTVLIIQVGQVFPAFEKPGVLSSKTLALDLSSCVLWKYKW